MEYGAGRAGAAPQHETLTQSTKRGLRSPPTTKIGRAQIDERGGGLLDLATDLGRLVLLA